ncbi:PREDICTED: uncharacterized protein LOC104811411 isoform X2 [Tarenaya hassleriana]|nr:PREDICTED: uncharacterized protein LOC104811411 isoform X2 [Tarenaya hassleriana]
MEALYAKLYDKYRELKKKKLFEIDEVNREQEEKFISFVSAAEKLIQHLSSEKENLQGIVENLTSELTSIRSAKDKDFAEYQKLLMEEEQKNKKLSEELEKLKEMLQEERGCKPQTRTPESARVVTRSMRKRSRPSEDIAEVCMTSPRVGSHDQVVPACCKNTRAISSESVICTFQTLSEYLLGMELSTINQFNGVCIIASHPSSGYSFSLTRVNNSRGGGEPELLYNLVSLGTFERVAPDWMRDALMFSPSMCPVFFERVSRVIKLRS